MLFPSLTFARCTHLCPGEPSCPMHQIHEITACSSHHGRKMQLSEFLGAIGAPKCHAALALSA
jgi:hypothetical protein